MSVVPAKLLVLTNLILRINIVGSRNDAASDSPERVDPVLRM